MRTTCRAHTIFLDFITLIIFGEHYKSRSSSLLHCLYALLLLVPLVQTFSSAPCSLIPSVCSFLLKRETKFDMLIKQDTYYSLVYFNLQCFRFKTGRQKILNRMVASNPPIYCALKFSMKKQETSTKKSLCFLIRICNLYSRTGAALRRAADPKNRN
jgi:hypothetical protein